MSKYNHFDYVPSSVDTGRSVFKFEKAVAGGCEIGYLYPMCGPVRMYPGSSLKLNLAMEIRSGALIAPLMDELYCDVFAFNVPNRIVWEHWKQFLGAVDDVLFDNLTEYQIPSFTYTQLHGSDATNSNAAYVASHTLAAWFELPPTIDYDEAVKINALPFRGYTFIWNEFFRPEQLVQPLLFSKTDDGVTGDNMDHVLIASSFTQTTINVVCPAIPVAAGSTTPMSGGVVLPTFRVHKSLYTSCLPKPSLESPNILAAVGSAPIGVIASAASTVPSNASQTNIYKAGTYAKGELLEFYTGSTSNVGDPIVADISQATLTVNSLRETLLLQRYYDVLNRAGSRYDEIIRNLFHTRASDAIIDIPELIIHKRFTIYRKEVISTTDNEYSPLGAQAAYIDSVIKDSFFTTSTTEHGFTHMLFTIRPARIRMANGVEPKWQQLAKFEQYYPQFDGMGDVIRYKREIYLDPTSGGGTPTELTEEFGYQEYGAEDKYQRNSAVGWLNCYYANHVPGFTLAEQLRTQPSLYPASGAGFFVGVIYSYISCYVEEEAFASCLAISLPETAPQFIVDIRLTGEIVHPMPVYNIPGMGDVL